MNRFIQVYRVMQCLGPQWLLFRAIYALRQKSGWDAWRLPVSTWKTVPLSAFLREGISSEPTAYSHYRRQSSVRFFIERSTGVAPAFDGFSEPRLLTSPKGEGQVRRNARPALASPFAAWDAGNATVSQTASRIQSGEFVLFDYAWVPCGQLPDWHRSPFTQQWAPSAGHWSRIDEFDSGDIKLVWELNRFGFVFPLVRAYWRTGDESLAECFWKLIENWRARNIPQAGVNWKCGQEVSLRVMAWCFGLYGFSGAAATSPERSTRLAQMLAVSGHRIASNLRYALSQRNNHGISEAAGLWTLGTLFPEFRQAAKWREMGRTALEALARELIYDDGGFSQHSANYHRVMVENYLWCIQLGRANGVEFTSELVRRVEKAGQWIASFLDPKTGRLPNWGSNDGAHILPLSNCGYLDYRPVVQATSMVTTGKPCLPSGAWDEQAWWLGCPVADKATAEVSTRASRLDFPDSGLTQLGHGNARVVLRSLRRFRHRPTQCDLLHLDLWLGSENVLRDTGSFSYNASDGSGRYFGSVAAHNTIQFDGREQMPVLGRFLYGQWPLGEVNLCVDDPTQVTAAYVDWQGCQHERTVKLKADRCLIVDRFSGFRQEAVLRWHLSSKVDWELDSSTCSSRLAVIRVTSAGKLRSSRLAAGWESLFYNTKTQLQVFELSLGLGCGSVETEVLFS